MEIRPQLMPREEAGSRRCIAYNIVYILPYHATQTAHTPLEHPALELPMVHVVVREGDQLTAPLFTNRVAVLINIHEISVVAPFCLAWGHNFRGQRGGVPHVQLRVLATGEQEVVLYIHYERTRDGKNGQAAYPFIPQDSSHDANMTCGPSALENPWCARIRKIRSSDQRNVTSEERRAEPRITELASSRGNGNGIGNVLV